MDASSLVVLLLLAAMASYIQTLTGFAIGLLFMGGVGLSGVIALPDAAVLVNIFVLINGVQMLAKGWRHIAWREFFWVLLPSFIFLTMGYWLLGVMLATSLETLRLILGLIIVFSSIQLLIKIKPFEKTSPPASFVFFGALSGIMGGLFSTAGPPLVYHFYRQPLQHATIRETLVAIFTLNGLLRLSLVSISGDIPSPSSVWGLLCIPVVILFTTLARRYPPPLNFDTMRRFVFILLFFSGISLGIPALIHMLGGSI